MPRETAGASRREFGFRLVATAAVVVGLLALWHLADFVFLAFGAALLAIVLNAPAGLVARHTPLPYKLSLALVTLLLLGVLVGAGWLFAPSVSEQLQELAARLPKAIDRLTLQAKQYNWVQALLEYSPAPREVISSTRGTLARVTDVFMNTVDAFTGVLVVLFVGIFLAAAPRTYVAGVLHLLPQARRADAQAVLDKIAATLRHWVVGQLCAMVIIGVATWAGLALLDVSLAVGLGVLAGLLEFIPTFGPIASAVPALLIALLDSPEKALYVAILYTGIQFAENHLLMPLVQRRAVHLPPAVSLLALLLLATLFGFLGLLFAIPMTAALFVAVRETYVKRVLRDPLA